MSRFQSEMMIMMSFYDCIGATLRGTHGTKQINVQATEVKIPFLLIPNTTHGSTLDDSAGHANSHLVKHVICFDLMKNISNIYTLKKHFQTLLALLIHHDDLHFTQNWHIIENCSMLPFFF